MQKGEQTDEWMALTFGGWQVGALHCTHGTSSSFDHSVWPQLSSLFKYMQKIMWWNINILRPTAILYFDIIKLSGLKLHSSITLLTFLRTVIKLNADKADNWVHGVSALQLPLNTFVTTRLKTQTKNRHERAYTCQRKCRVWFKSEKCHSVLQGYLEVLCVTELKRANRDWSHLE